MRMMDKTFAFAGDQALGGIVAGVLQDAGYALAADVGSADFVFSYCLAQSQLEDVYLGTGGLIESARPGCCLVDLSPSTVTLAKELYAMARVSELQALDAPLVVKDPCAHAPFSDPENLMLLVGGDDDAYAVAAPLLDALSDDVRYLGPAGRGQLAKGMCTVQQAEGIVSLAEARALAKSQDEDGAGAVEAAIAAGIAPEGAAGVYRAMLDGHFHGSYSCAVLMGELSAVLDGAEEIDLALPQVEACARLVELFLVVGGSDLPAPALSLVYGSQEEAAAHGIDWTRAEGIYGHDHDGAAGDDSAGDADPDAYGFDIDDGEGYAGFGGFSAN